METPFSHFGRCMRAKSASLECSLAPAVSVGSVQVSVCSLPPPPAPSPRTAWTMASQDFPSFPSTESCPVNKAAYFPGFLYLKSGTFPSGFI